MTKILILAEKSSAGNVIADYCKCTQKKAGYREGSTYIVTWAQGHLVDLAMPDKYGWSSWDVSQLPLIPHDDQWKFLACSRKNGKQQLKVIKTLLNRKDVSSVINACDPDREGEAIFRRIYNYLGVKKPVERLWAASLTDDSLAKAFSEIKPGSDYNGLADAADARAKDDWLIGMNASRAYHSSVGRVRTPTLALVVARDLSISNFEVKPFWSVACDLGDFVVETERINSESEAKNIAQKLYGQASAITKCEEKKITKNAPKLYSTTACQMDASKLFAMSPDRCDKALQSLYEKKLCSYPRTSSEFVTTDDLDDVRQLLTNLSDLPTFRPIVKAWAGRKINAQKLANNKKVEGHTALLPTCEVNEDKINSLSLDEQRILKMICVRLFQATFSSATILKMNVSAVCFDTLLKGVGSKVTDNGWLDTEKAANQVLNLPAPKEGITKQFAPISLVPGCKRTIKSVNVKAGKTTPPKPYTDASLLADMEGAARLVEDADDKQALRGSDVHAQGIGTAATRASIIKSLIDNKFISRKKGKLNATSKGRNLVKCVHPELISPVLTAKMETGLYKIEKNTLSEKDHLNSTKKIVEKFVYDAKIKESEMKNDFNCVGSCPKCGAPVYDYGKICKCENNTSVKQGNTWVSNGSCDYKMFKNICGHTLTDDELIKILNGDEVKVEGLKSKAGKMFSTKLSMDPNDPSRLVFNFD